MSYPDPVTSQFFQDVISKRQPLYFAVPLFSPLDRLSGANLAGIAEIELRKLIGNQDNSISDLIFLPFRDTNQSLIIGEDRAKNIYELDIAQLKRSSAILARFDGLAKDSGVAMEIGYAYGSGIPIGILLTDFIWEGACSSDAEWLIDPILENMSDICRSISDIPNVASSYYQSNLIQEYDAVRSFVTECFESFLQTQKKPLLKKTSNNKLSIYIDVMGGRYKWSQYEQDRIKTACETSQISVELPERYQHNSLKTIYSKAAQDMEKAASASIAVFSGDAPEMDAGSAAIFGMCKSIGIFTIFQYSSEILYKGAGGQKMKINLMIEQAADVVKSSVEETIAQITKLTAKTDL
jgi:nucleoside 2-deoxyribosyltransferase